MKLLVLLLLPCLSLSEVMTVPGFGNCNQFFLGKKPPQFTAPVGTALPAWFTSVKEICQCLWDKNNNRPKYFYATLYSTDWKIPIYSAYKFKKSACVERSDHWYIEPQLDGYNNKPCMEPKRQKTINNQAVNDDYKDQDLNKPSYDRGHLYPVQHTYNDDSMLATSTLTNAAPQDACFNRLQWNNHEKLVITDLIACDEAYVVTGVVPHDTIKLKKRVTVSKYYWRATCCLKNGVITGQGYFGPNNNNVVQTLSITDLQTRLAKDYKMNNIKMVIFPSLPAPPPLPTTPPNRKRVREDEITDDDCDLFSL